MDKKQIIKNIKDGMNIQLTGRDEEFYNKHPSEVARIVNTVSEQSLMFSFKKLIYLMDVLEKGNIKKDVAYERIKFTVKDFLEKVEGSKKC